MTLSALCRLTLAATFALSPAMASDLAALTEPERAALRAEIRAYLIENPDVLMEAMTELQNREAAQQVKADAALVTRNADAIFADGYSWIGGNPDGDITVVEFMDYRCGYCRQAFAEINALVKADGNIRFVVKELPILGEQSLISSRHAMAAKLLFGDAAYERMHAALMTLRGDATPAVLDRVAEQLGLDGAAISARAAEPDITEMLTRTSDLAAVLQVSGTPTFVVGKRMLRGYLPPDAMRDLLAEARSD